MWANEFSDVMVLTKPECYECLSQVSLGRIAASIDALPVILPVHFVLSGESVLFPALPGSKLDAATTGTVVAFEADAEELLGGSYWSVLLQGLASSVGDGSDRTQERPFQLDPWPTVQRNLRLVRVEPTLVSGRKFRISGEGPSAEFRDSPSF
jgi:uncharacterized protein